MGRLDTELLGLQIVSLDTASIVGEVDGLVVDHLTMTVAGFLVDLGLYEAKVLPFDSVKAIGTDAVIVERAEDVRRITTEPRLENLARRDITISFATAMTKSGCNVGAIGDYLVDTDTGSILGVELLTSPESDQDEVQSQFLAASAVYKLGRDVVVLSDELAEHSVPDAMFLAAPTFVPAAAEPAVSEPGFASAETPSADDVVSVAPAAQAQTEEALPDEDLLEDTVTDLPALELGESDYVAQDSDARGPQLVEPDAEGTRGADVEPTTSEGEPTPSVLAEPEPAEPSVDAGPPLEAAPEAPTTAADEGSTAPRHFLLGKRVLRRIQTPDGEVIAEANETVTFEIIQKAKATDQLLILSLNVE